MGPLGWQETLFIMVFALLVLGPKKLPEVGKTIGKAMGEFRKATSELKGTWEREMANMERETGVKETAAEIDRQLTAATMDETYHGTDSSYDSSYGYGSGVEQNPHVIAENMSLSGTDNLSTGAESPDTLSTEGTSATQDAQTAVAEAEPPTGLAAVTHADAETVHVADTIPRMKPGANGPDQA
jgi:TatA/E family protein of Tat protein translocase